MVKKYLKQIRRRFHSDIEYQIMEMRRQIDEMRYLLNEINDTTQRTNTAMNSSFSAIQMMILDNKEEENYDKDIENYVSLVHRYLEVYQINKEYEETFLRIGKNNDGGYHMTTPFSSEKIAYSFGISDDVSWDSEVVNYGYEVFQYDHTIDCLPIKNEHFHWNQIGITGEKETENLKNIQTILDNNGHTNQKGMLLKMDVEGSEWSFLRNCPLEILNQFDQIVMELHGLNDFTNMEEICLSLERLTKNHKVIYIHGNNYSKTYYVNNKVLPNVLEITLIRDDGNLVRRKKAFPKVSDQANNNRAEDIRLGVW